MRAGADYRAAAAAGLAATVLLAGCGSAGAPRRAGPTGGTGGRATTRSAAPAGGAGLFPVQCGMCHTIGDPDSPHQGPGGDVLASRLSRRDMLAFARDMPRVHGPRTEAQLEAIVSYLQRLQRSGVR